MTENQAKKQLKTLLDHFLTGTILHFLGEIFGERAIQAQRDNDSIAYEQCKTIEHALFVVGLGVHGAYPKT